RIVQHISTIVLAFLAPWGSVSKHGLQMAVEKQKGCKNIDDAKGRPKRPVPHATLVLSLMCHLLAGCILISEYRFSPLGASKHRHFGSVPALLMLSLWF